MKRAEILGLIQEISDNLAKGEILSKAVGITEDTVLMGPGSDFDSIAFVTLFTEIEDKLSEIAGREIYLVLDMLQDVDTESTSLKVSALVDYIIQILASDVI